MNSQQLYAVKNQLDEMTKFEESFIKKNSPKPSLQTLLKPSPIPIPVMNDNSKNPLGLLNNVINLKPPKKKDLSSLISNLESKGLMNKQNGATKSSSSSVPSNSVLKSLLSKPSKTTNQNETSSSSSSTISSDMITLENPFKNFKLDNKLTLSDPTDFYIKFFITNKPNKCGTCGKRFSKTIQGQAQRRAHLDWHFRINKRLKESKLIQSRAWYIDDDEFCQFRDWEIFNGDDSSTKENEEKIEIKKEKKYVVVPEGSSTMNVVCGVCKETIRAIFNDDLGEWIWDGCVMQKGRVFHETCFEESSKNNSNNNSTGSNGSKGGLLLNGLLKREREKDLDLGMLKDIVKNVKLNPTTKSS